MNFLYQERLDRIEKTIRNQKADRVPVVGNILEWAYYYQGYVPMDGLRDKEIAIRVYRSLCKDFYWDGLIPGTIRRSTPQLYQILQGGPYHYSPEGMIIVDPSKISYMHATEYPDLIRDPYQYIFEKLLPRKYALFADEDSQRKREGIARAIKMIHEFLNDNTFSEIANQDYEIVTMIGYFINTPIDSLLNQFRGLRDIIKDIKTNPEMVLAAGDSLMQLVELKMEHAVQRSAKVAMIPTHLPAFLNPRDFEKVYWPTFRCIVERFAQKGIVTLCYFERKLDHLYEFFQELPKGSTIGFFEDDDLREVKKKLGKTMCLMGGMSQEHLKYRSKQECIDYAKALVDDIAYDGGYIFSVNKPIIFSDDANPENLKAVNQFVHEYGVYA